MRQDITIADGTVVHTLAAFPFDSSPNLVTTEQGYRRGDRAVDAWTMQRTFAQFFSDGVFGTPADAFQIAKAASGLAVTIQPGMAVVQGAMGGIKESDGALTVTLDTAAAAGNVCYGIMLRYDNNSDVRSLGIRVVKGVAGSNPQPPAPDTSSAGVKELRLGYVTVPNGATDLSNATVTNEKGLSACPYAAPFDTIDMSQVTEDARASANAAMVQLLAYFDQYKGAVDAALDDSEATYLQQQISALQEQISALDIDLSDEVDNETIEYASDNYPTVPKKLRVKDGGIGTAKLADGAVTVQKVGSGVVSFTDDASSMQDASDRVAATPKLVDSKIWDPRSCSAKLTKEASVGPNEYLSMTNVTVSGFTKDSNSITAPYKMLAFVYISVVISQYSNPFNIRVNGSTVVAISSTGNFYYMLELDAGDKVQVYNSASNTYNQVTNFTMNGV